VTTIVDGHRGDALAALMRSTLRPHVLPERSDPAAASAARTVANVGGAAVRAIVFFGSRKTNTRPDRYSPWDFLVLVSSYRRFYQSLASAGVLRRNATLSAVLNAQMPPSVIGLQTTHPDTEDVVRIKCPVVSMRHFGRDTSDRRRDHFLTGRLFQPVEIVYAADQDAADAVLDGLVRSSIATCAWVRPYLPATFDVADYCRTLLAVSFAAEIRPEPSTRALALWASEEPLLRPVFTTLLEALRESGALRQTEAGRYALADPVTRVERLRRRAYFRVSLLRATARWVKHVITYDDWLEFLVRKARRHSGEDIVLTPWERRLPLVFLWPRVLRYLRDRNVRRVPQS
jgi:hypothetical protein